MMRVMTRCYFVSKKTLGNDVGKTSPSICRTLNGAVNTHKPCKNCVDLDSKLEKDALQMFLIVTENFNQDKWNPNETKQLNMAN